MESAQAMTMLQEGISMLLSRWDLIDFAISQASGGPHTASKVLQLASDVFNWFTQSKELDVYDLEDLLDEFMISALNIVVEDGSIERVADDLMKMQQECLEGNYELIQNIREATSKNTSQSRIEPMNDDDVEDDDKIGDVDASDMMVDGDLTNQGKMTMELRSQSTTEAEDGWVRVSSRKKGAGIH